MELTSDQIAAIRARNEARTRGKWESGPLFAGQAGDYVVWASRGKRRKYIGNVGTLVEPVLEASPENDIIFDVARRNAIFIAGCSEDIPNLLDTLDAKEQELIETRGQRDRLQRKLEEIRRQEAALPGTTELQRHVRELEGMIPELQRRQKRHIEHIAGLERNNHKLREQLTKLKGMLSKINQTKYYMKSPEDIKQISKREELKWLDEGDDDD